MPKSDAPIASRAKPVCHSSLTPAAQPRSAEAIGPVHVIALASTASVVAIRQARTPRITDVTMALSVSTPARDRPSFLILVVGLRRCQLGASGLVETLKPVWATEPSIPVAAAAIATGP